MNYVLQFIFWYAIVVVVASLMGSFMHHGNSIHAKGDE